MSVLLLGAARSFSALHSSFYPHLLVSTDSTAGVLVAGTVQSGCMLLPVQRSPDIQGMCDDIITVGVMMSSHKLYRPDAQDVF